MKNRVRSIAITMLVLCGGVFAQDAAVREWSDSTGRFKVRASLMEQRDGDVYIKSIDGKTMKIPISRLCAADQEFLKGGSNPFEEVGGATADMPAAPLPAAGPAPSSTSSAGVTQGNAPLPWSTPWQIDWDQVEMLDRGFDAQWSFTPPAPMELPFEAKRAAVPKKSNFFEGMRRLEINPLAQRAVAGYTVSFSVPKPLSRLSLIDLPSGKALQSDAVECDMCPLAVLNDGSTVLMQGTGKVRDGTETPDQLQLWRLQGKKVARSGIWIPFQGEGQHGSQNANVNSATPLADNRIVLLSEHGHLACFDALTRQAIWHARLNRNHAMDYSVDRQQLFLLDEHSLSVLDPNTGRSLSSMTLEDKPQLSWPRIRLSPSGDKLLLTFGGEYRLIDLKSGETLSNATIVNQGIAAAHGLSYPDDDYALLDNHLLLHLPSQIIVCDYQDAAIITSVGGVEFVGILGDQGGLVVPTEFPHPKAKATLTQALDDPNIFLIHPGVAVSLNVNGVGGEYRAQVEEDMRQAAEAAGYKITNNADISLMAAISGPKQEGISYIGAGSYIANKYTSEVRLEWQGKNVWSRSGNNVPGFIQTQGDQTIQQKLDELGQRPNIAFFKHLAFPKMLQTPRENATGQNNSNALLVSKFTLQGLIDSQ